MFLFYTEDEDINFKDNFKVSFSGFGLHVKALWIEVPSLQSNLMLKLLQIVTFWLDFKIVIYKIIKNHLKLLFLHQ